APAPAPRAPPRHPPARQPRREGRVRSVVHGHDHIAEPVKAAEIVTPSAPGARYPTPSVESRKDRSTLGVRGRGRGGGGAVKLSGKRASEPHGSSDARQRSRIRAAWREGSSSCGA